jgi:hypothetical protein
MEKIRRLEGIRSGVENNQESKAHGSQFLWDSEEKPECNNSKKRDLTSRGCNGGKRLWEMWKIVGRDARSIPWR